MHSHITFHVQFSCCEMPNMTLQEDSRYSNQEITNPTKASETGNNYLQNHIATLTVFNITFYKIMSDIVPIVQTTHGCCIFVNINKQSITHWIRYTSWNFHFQPIILTSFHYLYYVLHEWFCHKGKEILLRSYT